MRPVERVRPAQGGTEYGGSVMVMRLGESHRRWQQPSPVCQPPYALNVKAHGSARQGTLPNSPAEKVSGLSLYVLLRPSN